jgi:hypothetical protein
VSARLRGEPEVIKHDRKDALVNRIIKLTLIVCLAAIAVPAAASAAKAPKQATFKASIRGTQVTTWSYEHQATGPCNGNAYGSGTVTMGYQSPDPGKITAYEIRKSSPLFSQTHGRPMIVPNIDVAASATMEGEYAASGPPDPSQCEDNGGGVEPVPQDCGTVASGMDVNLSYVNKDKLLVKGDAHGWNKAADASGSGTELRNVFSNCPFWIDGGYGHAPAEGDLESVDEPLTEKTLFDSSKRKLVVDGSDTNCYDQAGWTPCGSEEGEFRGKIVTTWKLTLKRVK